MLMSNELIWYLGLSLLGMFVFGILAAIIGARKKSSFTGFAISFCITFLAALIGSFIPYLFAGILIIIFAIVGVVIAFTLDGRPQCGNCGTRLNGMPQTCPSCRYKFKGMRKA